MSGKRLEDVERDAAHEEINVSQIEREARAREYCASCLRRAGNLCRITQKATAESLDDCKRAGWRDLGRADPSADRVALRFMAEKIYKPTQDIDPEDDR